MTAVLMKALQESMSKIEHLEARLFEFEDIIKDLKKPKAKAKAKAKNVA